ncbi:hypothetical protein M405DRAFT_468041 [Rhizopogon salebrosus TDB-379]|nr:hypothetical protein M405DRAFT_468041 [Rhizopogon salebrosus TDB-379]
MPKRYIRMFISWLSLVFKKITFRSYKTFLDALRLFQHCELSGGKERAFRERGLALSSQPTDPDKLSASMTLAVPLLEAPPQSEGLQPVSSLQLPMPGPTDEGLNAMPSSTDPPENLVASSIPTSMPEPSIPADMPPQPAAPESYFDVTLIPIIPMQIKRYERKISITDNYVLHQMKKGPLDYSEELPPAWQSLTHPEGALFFFHPYKRVFTDADVRISQTAAKVGRAVKKAYEEAHNAGVSLPPSVELALELMGDNEFGYYFADYDERVIFWFEDLTCEPLMSNVRGVGHKSHLKYAIETQYWRHVELFPNKRSLPKDDVVRLQQIVMHTQAENITSDTCLAPFGPGEVADMLTLMDPLMNSIGMEHEHSVWIVARLMRLFCNAKFVNFCGQPGARLDADQPLYGDPSARPKNIILRVMNVVLFGSPDAHSKGLHRIWVDETIVQPRWKNFIDRLNTEWSGYTIFSTVMLAVDISFLAVPSVQGQTAAILVAYLSTLCAMGSLVVSLVLAGQVNDTRRNNAEGVALFMVQMTQSMLGLDSLALMLSLPFALLIWGMTFFGAALSIVIFSTSDTLTISVASPIWAAILILTTWPVLATNDIHVSNLRAKIIARVLRHGSPGYSVSSV